MKSIIMPQDAKTFLHCIFLLIFLLPCTTSSTLDNQISATPLPPTHELVYSYETHRPWRIIASDLSTELKKLRISEGYSIDIDISSSLLGNEGLDALSNELFRTTGTVNNVMTTEKYGPCQVSLETRLNRISGQGAAHLLDKMIEWERNGFEQKDEADSSVGNKLNLNHIQSLDLSLNDLTHNLEENSCLESSLTRFMTHVLSSISVSKESKCIRLDRCNLQPTSCRAIGLGILEGIQASNEVRNSTKRQCGGEISLSLHLSGNNFGCPGAAALAAALKVSERVHNDDRRDCTILNTLDLSSCNIGDAGAEAIAFALETNPGCIRHLNLSCNEITQRGAIALGRALMQKKSSLDTLDLSANVVGEEGIEVLAQALKRGSIKSLILRTCSINANGCAALGSALGTLMSKARSADTDSLNFEIDLSGNRIGSKKIIEKPKTYSASALTSKASATTRSSLSFIGKKIKSGLKDVGVDMSDPFGVSSLESDDEEEKGMSDIDGEGGGPSSGKDSCGASIFYDSFVEAFPDDAKLESLRALNKGSCKIVMRMCSLDEGGQDALAALFLFATDNSCKTTIDITMNDGIENENASRAMSKGKTFPDLNTMAKRHLENIEQRAQDEVSTEVEADRVIGALSSFSDESDVEFW